MKKRKLNSSQPAPVSYESETLLDAVTREVDCFYKQSIDWKETLVRHFSLRSAPRKAPRLRRSEPKIYRSYERI